MLRSTSPCDRFMQHNIEHKGQGELSKQSSYGLCACTDVANFIPSTVSLNVVNDPSHIHWTNKRARAYRQQSPWLWSKTLTYTLDKQACTSAHTTFHDEKARQEVIKTNKSHESLLIFTNPDTTKPTNPTNPHLC